MRILRSASAHAFKSLAPFVLLSVAAFAAPGCAEPGGESDIDTDDDGAYEDGEGQSVEEISVAGNWQPSAAALNAGMQQFVAYDSPPPWQGGVNCGGSLLAPTRELGDFIDRTFSGMTTYGGYSCRPNTANTSETSVHGTGRALDLMIPTTGGKADNTKGDPIANWLISNAQALGVQYVIWDRMTWGASRSGTKLKTYTGPNPHIDHLHVELSNEAGAGQNRVRGRVETSGANLTVRSGPATSFGSVGAVADGASVTIFCQKSGQSISGSTGTTALWDRLEDGFVSHAFITLTGNTRVAVCP